MPKEKKECEISVLVKKKNDRDKLSAKTPGNGKNVLKSFQKSRPASNEKQTDKRKTHSG
jgi:hypothetical protein